MDPVLKVLLMAGLSPEDREHIEAAEKAREANPRAGRGIELQENGILFSEEGATWEPFSGKFSVEDAGKRVKFADGKIGFVLCSVPRHVDTYGLTFVQHPEKDRLTFVDQELCAWSCGPTKITEIEVVSGVN